MRALSLFLIFGYALSVSASNIPGPSPEQVYIAEAKKTSHYVKEGLISGGDGSVQNVVLKDLRFSKNNAVQGVPFERLVLDIDVKSMPDGVAIPRPPFYQVDLTPELKRVVVTVFGSVKLGLNPAKSVRLLRASSTIERLEFLPQVLKDRWSFVLYLKKPIGIEVFELSQPTRVILDLR